MTKDNLKLYGIPLVYYTEENFPERGNTVFALSDEDLTQVSSWKIKEHYLVQEALETYDCEDIGQIYQLTTLDRKILEEEGEDILDLTSNSFSLSR